LPVKRFHGVGGHREELVIDRADLARWPIGLGPIRLLGPPYWQIARGIDERE
jgi:hypothetical protein